MNNESNRAMLAGFAGIAATLLVGSGEFLMHFSSTGYVNENPYAYLLGVSRSRVIAGHFLIAISGPLYFLGYWHVYQALKPAQGLLPLVFFFAGTYGFGTALVWIGSRALIVLIAQAQAEAIGPDAGLLAGIVADYEFLYENVLQIIRVTTLMASGLFVFLVLRRETRYPRWMALANPFLTLALVFVSYVAVPAIGVFLLPTAMNVAHFVFFSSSLIALSRRS